MKYLFWIILFCTSCGQPSVLKTPKSSNQGKVEKVDCSKEKMYENPLFTNISLDSIVEIWKVYYEKGSFFKKKLNLRKIEFSEPRFQKETNRWIFNFNESIDISYDYRLVFVGKHKTYNFELSELTIGSKLVYANKELEEMCDLLKYSLSGKKMPGGNIELLRENSQDQQ